MEKLSRTKLFIYLCIYLFICSLLKEAVRLLDLTSHNDRIYEFFRKWKESILVYKWSTLPAFVVEMGKTPENQNSQYSGRHSSRAYLKRQMSS